MPEGVVVTSSFIEEGLAALQGETFTEDGLGYGADEVISTSVIQQGMTRSHEDLLRHGIWGHREFGKNFSHELMYDWLQEVRRSYMFPVAGPTRHTVFISS